MTKEQAISGAQQIANKENMVMVAFDDPMMNAEEPDGTWGYSPNAARHKDGSRKGKLILGPYAVEEILIAPK